MGRFTKLEILMEMLDSLIEKVHRSKYGSASYYNSPQSMARVDDRFEDLKTQILIRIRSLVLANTTKEEKHFLEEIAAGVTGIHEVGGQYAHNNMGILLKKLKKF